MVKRASSTVAFLAGAALLLTTLGWRYLAGPKLSTWGLPSDLLDRARDITELTLPSSIDRVDWLPPNLKVLDISHSRVTDLSHLPDGLEDLNASYTTVRVLADLPPHLKTLDVSATDIGTLEHLPLGLLRLKVGSTRLEGITGLPPHLEELSIDGATLTDLRSLPTRLKTLSLKGTGVESLEGIPPSLHSLALIGTRVTSLKGSPQTLERLELSANAKLEIDYLPTYLSRLVIDQPAIPNLSKLSFLTDLDAILAVPRTTTLLPPSLGTLRVRDLSASGHELPPDLRTLGLIGARLRALRATDLPRALDSLELDSCLNDSFDYDGPPTLQQLSLRFSHLTHVGRLPDRLLSLDASGAPLQDLPADLPANLRVLRLRWTKIKSLRKLPAQLRILDLRDSHEIAALPSLPENLQELLLGRTRITRLGKLPPHLKTLDISGLKLLDAHGHPVRDLGSIAGFIPETVEEIRLAPYQFKVLGRAARSLKRFKFVHNED